MTELSESILALREKGLSYREIQKELNCSKATIAYHLSDGEKEKTRERVKRYRGSNSLIRKTESFQATKGKNNKATHFHRGTRRGEYLPQNFTYKDAIEYIGDNLTCYLTGDTINLDDPSSYSFDHIVPVSKGGSNELHNLGLTTREANMAKADLSVEEFVELCVKVAKHYGRI